MATLQKEIKEMKTLPKPTYETVVPKPTYAIVTRNNQPENPRPRTLKEEKKRRNPVHKLCAPGGIYKS
jgi:hypothetical protein